MVCPYSLAVRGGVQAQVLGLSRTLRAMGVDVQVLAPCDGQPPETWVTPLGNSIPYAQNGSIAPLAPDPAAQFRMLGAIKDFRFDLLHLHEPLAPGPTFTSVLVKPVPLVGTFHASGRIGIYRWARPFLRRLAAKIDTKIAVSQEAAAMAQRNIRGDYDILFNGIEMSQFASRTTVAKEGPTILFLGRHEPRKGLSLLLEALQMLPDNVSLWVAGEGPETTELRARYGEDGRISWLGFVSEAEKIARLQAADIFCAPSLGGESFGIVLLEAMAAGTAVVASDLVAYKAVARNNQDAFFFRTGDADSLAKTLLDTLDNEVKTQAAIASGLLRAEQFSMKTLAEAYLIKYEQLLR